MAKMFVVLFTVVIVAAAQVENRGRSVRLAATNSLDEAASNYPINPYNFGYDVRDELGNHNYRKEEADERGVVRGTYGFTDAAGLYRFVDYVADASGFRANIRSNEPGIGGPHGHAADTNLATEEPPRAILELMAAPPRAKLVRRAGNSPAQREQFASAPQAYTLPKPPSSGAERFRYPVPQAPATPVTATEASEPSASSSPAPRGSRFSGQ